MKAGGRVFVAISYNCGTRNSLSQGLNVINRVLERGIRQKRGVRKSRGGVDRRTVLARMVFWRGGCSGE